MGAEKGGGQKAAAAAADGEKKDDAKAVSVYKLDMHCECDKEIKSALKHLEGVESVKADCAANKLTVTGKVDPAKVKARLEEKTKKKVDIVSPQPKKDGGGGGDKKPQKKAEMKPEKKPPKESTVVLKLTTPCDRCLTKMQKMIKKIKGVDTVAVDSGKDLVSVKGRMDVKDMLDHLSKEVRQKVEEVRQKVEVVPPKKGDKKEGNYTNIILLCLLILSYISINM